MVRSAVITNLFVQTLSSDVLIVERRRLVYVQFA